MGLIETALGAIVQKVFDYALEQGQNSVVDWARDKLGLEPQKQAFKRALDKAYREFEHQHPEWAQDLFNASFFEKEGMPVLAQFLVRDGHPDPSELARCGAASFNIYHPERRTTLVRELEPVTTDFLDNLAQELRREPALSGLSDSRALDQLVIEVQALRHKFGAEQATPGTRWDYLRWLIERNSYLDPRGTFQTHRQIQVKLDDIYISLQAQCDEVPDEVDRRLPEHEMALFKAKNTALQAEKIAGRGEQPYARRDSRMLFRRNAPGEILELGEIVNRHAHLVILGDPGSGKSTLLSYLALKHAQALYAGRSEVDSNLSLAHFPLLLRIADYAEYGMPKGQSLSDYLVDYYQMHECPSRGLGDLLTRELAGGNCLVLLNGLDEIVSADDRRKVAHRVEDFIRHHNDRSNRFVITSRIAGYRSAPLSDSFVHYTVREMEESQIRRFLERWCSAVEAAQRPDVSCQERENTAQREAEAIMRSVQTAPGVRRLAANPLLLRILALIHHTGAQLPQKRIELYKLAADTLARTWRPAQGVPESALVKEEYLTRLLGKLAYWMHAEKPTGIALEQGVRSELGQEWARLHDLPWDEDDPAIEIEVQAFLLAVREHTGLFVERAPKRYGFMHLTFEEYYAARYLVARSKDRAKRIRQHLHDPRWEEPILLAFGFVGLDSPDDAAELVETAILAEGEDAQALEFAPSRYEEWLGRDFLFALRCLRDDIPMRPKVLQRLVERLVDELLNESGPAKFERYRKALEERLLWVPEDDTVVIPRLLAVLHNGEVWARARAAECLGLRGSASSEVVKALIAALRDADAYVRQKAAFSLGHLHRLFPAVLSPVLSSPDVFNTWFAATRILVPPSSRQSKPTEEEIEAREQDMLDAWVTTLQQSTDTQARVQAAYMLGAWGARAKNPWKICHALITALQQDTEIAVRSEAATSLGMGASIGMWQGVPEVLDALVMALTEDAEADVRSSVIWGLEQLKDTSSEVLDALVMALQQDHDVWVRSRSAECLGRLGNAFPQILDVLTAALRQDGEVDVRSMAAWSLAQLGQGFRPEDRAIFLEGLKGAKYPNVRSDCARLLGEIGQADEPTQQTLWQGLLDRRGFVRKACAQAFVQLGQRFPERLASIESRLVLALADPAFNQLDDPEPDEPGIERPAYDYAYDALWMLVIGSEVDRKG